MAWIHLPHRALLKVTGKDRRSFLQGLLTNDLALLSPEKPLYAALLTPQGKFLHDLFLREQDETLYLEAERERLPDLIKRLSLFKLRADVTLTPCPDLCVLVALSPTEADTLEASFEDPRRGVSWRRAFVSQGLLETLSFEEDLATYAQARLALGLPEGSQDMVPDKAIPLECGLDDLGAISWEKGCYMGQELTARTKHRGLVRKRYLPFTSATPLEAAFGKAILKGDQKVGTVLSTEGTQGLARLRLEALEKGSGENSGTPLLLEGSPLKVHIPSWVRLDPTPSSGKATL